MSLDKHKRVMWLVRLLYPNRLRITNNELRIAIEREIGTDVQTYKRNRAVMIRHKYIVSSGKKHVILTNKDITDSD